MHIGLDLAKLSPNVNGAVFFNKQGIVVILIIGLRDHLCDRLLECCLLQSDAQPAQLKALKASIPLSQCPVTSFMLR